jgi:hypothetical protein
MDEGIKVVVENAFSPNLWMEKWLGIHVLCWH